MTKSCNVVGVYPFVGAKPLRLLVNITLPPGSGHGPRLYTPGAFTPGATTPMNWSVFPPPTPLKKSYYNCQKLVFHAKNFLRLDWEGQSKFFREKLQILRSRIPIWRAMLLARLFRNSGPERSESRILGEIWENNDRAFSRYVPVPYSGVVTDFRPLKQYRMFDNPDARWDRLAQGGQEVVTLPVYPAGMLVEPYVKHLANALRMSIDRAMSSGQASSQPASAPVKR
jgi:hypothetical protein